MLLIKYKNNLQINIIEKIFTKNEQEFSVIFNYIITESLKQKEDFIKKEICLIMLNKYIIKQKIIKIYLILIKLI